MPLVRSFETNGFEGTTTDEIAAAAEVTERTLYRYVGSKEQLLSRSTRTFWRPPRRGFHSQGNSTGAAPQDGALPHP